MPAEYNSPNSEVRIVDLKLFCDSIDSRSGGSDIVDNKNNLFSLKTKSLPQRECFLKIINPLLARKKCLDACMLIFSEQSAAPKT